MTIDADNQTEVSGSTGLNSAEGVFYHHRISWFYCQLAGRLEEGVRMGLAPQPQSGGHVAVHLHIEHVGDAARRQDCSGVGRRGDHGHRHTFGYQPFEELQRPRIHLHPFFPENCPDEIVLAIPDRAHRRVTGRIVESPPGEFDSPRPEEVVDPLEARAPIDVVAVVALDVEVHERGSPGRSSATEVVIEDRLPGTRVDRCGVGEDPVEVEQHCPKPLPDRRFDIAGGMGALSCHAGI
jgi:hypothetical protein